MPTRRLIVSDQGQPLGSARIDLHANPAPMISELRQAEAEAKVGVARVEQAANSAVASPVDAANASKTLNEVLKEQGKELKAATSGFKALITGIHRFAWVS